MSTAAFPFVLSLKDGSRDWLFKCPLSFYPVDLVFPSIGCHRGVRIRRGCLTDDPDEVDGSTCRDEQRVGSCRVRSLVRVRGGQLSTAAFPFVLSFKDGSKEGCLNNVLWPATVYSARVLALGCLERSILVDLVSRCPDQGGMFNR